MTKKIREAKKELKKAEQTLTSNAKEVQAAVTSVENWAKKAPSHADKAADPTATKATAATASAQAHKAFRKAQEWCAIAASKLPSVSEAMKLTLQKGSELFEAEDELRKLKDATENAGQEPEEEEEEEDDEDEESEVLLRPTAHDPANKYEESEEAIERAKQSLKTSKEHADRAAIAALQAAAREFLSKAAGITRRRRAV
jgi:hypothetical protein